MKRILLGLLLTFAFLSPALADTAPTRISLPNGCSRYTICSAETDTTAGCDNGTSNLVVNAAGHHQIGFDASQSTASTFVCTPRLGSTYSATKAVDLLADPMTETAYVTSASGTFTKVWVECSAINVDGTVTITLDLCP